MKAGGFQTKVEGRMRGIARFLPILLLAGLASCASSPPAPPKPLEDPELGRLTQWLKLTPEQQKQAKVLLEEYAERYARMREKWEQQHRVRQEEALVSRSLFVQDLFAILTEEQRLAFRRAAMEMEKKARRTF